MATYVYARLVPDLVIHVQRVAQRPRKRSLRLPKEEISIVDKTCETRCSHSQRPQTHELHVKNRYTFMDAPSISLSTVQYITHELLNAIKSDLPESGRR